MLTHFLVFLLIERIDIWDKDGKMIIFLYIYVKNKGLRKKRIYLYVKENRERMYFTEMMKCDIMDYCDYKTQKTIQRYQIYNKYLRIETFPFMKDVNLCKRCCMRVRELIKDECNFLFHEILETDEIDMEVEGDEVDKYWDGWVFYNEHTEELLNKTFYQMVKKVVVENIFNQGKRIEDFLIGDRICFEESSFQMEIFYQLYRIYNQCIEDGEYNQYCEACIEFGHTKYEKNCKFKNTKGYDKYVEEECKKKMNDMIEEIRRRTGNRKKYRTLDLTK